MSGGVKIQRRGAQRVVVQRALSKIKAPQISDPHCLLREIRPRSEQRYLKLTKYSKRFKASGLVRDRRTRCGTGKWCRRFRWSYEVEAPHASARIAQFGETLFSYVAMKSSLDGSYEGLRPSMLSAHEQPGVGSVRIDLCDVLIPALPLGSKGDIQVVSLSSSS